MDRGGEEAQRQTVMIVDDYDGARAITRQALEMLGYRVVEAEGGEEAVELARLELPDLILMDLSMPNLDGFAAMQLIRRLIGLHDVPVIIVSAHTSPQLRADALAFGCCDFIAKPVNLEILRTSVERYIRIGRDTSETISN